MPNQEKQSRLQRYGTNVGDGEVVRCDGGALIGPGAGTGGVEGTARGSGERGKSRAHGGTGDVTNLLQRHWDWQETRDKMWIPASSKYSTM